MSTFKSNWRKQPRFFRILTLALLGLIGITALGFIFGFILMLLWNALMPQLFGLKAISYWQGIGLFILARILFGGFGGEKSNPTNKMHHSGRHSKRLHSEDVAPAHPKRDEDMEAYEAWWQSEGKDAFDNYLKK